MRTKQDNINLAEELTAIFDQENVILDKDLIKPYTKNTLGIKKEVKGIVFAKNKEQIQQLVILANKVNLQLYPVSTGLLYWN